MKLFNKYVGLLVYFCQLIYVVFHWSYRLQEMLDTLYEFIYIYTGIKMNELS